MHISIPLLLESVIGFIITETFYSFNIRLKTAYCVARVAAYFGRIFFPDQTKNVAATPRCSGSFLWTNKGI
jgi:hypothetical protein